MRPWTTRAQKLANKGLIDQPTQEKTTMIKPTVGRVVWFYPAGHQPGEQPLGAIVAHVHSDECVNLTVFSQNGNAYGETSVPLYQGEGERPKGYFCEWMPYQKGQAAKTEALEAKLGPVSFLES